MNILKVKYMRSASRENHRSRRTSHTEGDCYIILIRVMAVNWENNLKTLYREKVTVRLGQL